MQNKKSNLERSRMEIREIIFFHARALAQCLVTHKYVSCTLKPRGRGTPPGLKIVSESAMIAATLAAAAATVESGLF